MAKHGLGPNAPAHPQLGQRIFHNEQGRLRDERLRHLALGLLKPVLRRVNNGPQIEFEMRPEHFAATTHLFAEHRLGFKKLAPHVHLLGALAGEQEDHRRFGVARMRGRGAGRVPHGQCLGSIRHAVTNNHPPVAKGLSTHLQSEGDVGQVDFGVLLEVFAQIRGGGVESGFGFR